eukprot:1141135-Pelagomonas_calceolata.AAC.8
MPHWACSIVLFPCWRAHVAAHVASRCLKLLSMSIEWPRTAVSSIWHCVVLRLKGIHCRGFAVL